MTQPDILAMVEAPTHEPASSLDFIPARPRARLDGTAIRRPCAWV
jgi:hypothetical protein